MNISSRFPTIQEHANDPAQGEKPSVLLAQIAADVIERVVLDGAGAPVASIVYDAPKEKWPCVMVDIETLGTGDDAVILEIGVMCFDLVGRVFGPRDSWQLDSLLQEERSIDADTVRWWLAPERAEAFAELTGKRGLPELWHGLQELTAFLGRHPAPGGEVWAKGDFDLRLLEHAMNYCDVPVPWKYWQRRELRTVLKFMRVPVDRDATAHRAEDDAGRQVLQLFHALPGLPLGRELNFMKGWMVYRNELAVTRATLLPAWESLPDEVREAWCAGVWAAVEAAVPPITADLSDLSDGTAS